MTILSRFLKFLEWLESIQAFLHFLTEPVGLSMSATLLFYFTIQHLGCDILSAMTLSLSLAIALFYSLEQAGL